MSRKPAPNLQYAALPYRQRADGVFEVMLITSRETRRWIIPKGWPVQLLAPHESAAREALEEGGLVGRIGEHSIGIFHYDKQLPDGSAVSCTVRVFALEVEQQLTSWPEQDWRSTRWFTLQEAAGAVKEPELRAIMENLAALLA
ncbi:MAG TPA: NUDIX hydrolase [Hyphomicrobiaceae bacterium]|nr:NUDIX hydrolase [Hyphomicrobiaceae bacterium]